MQKIALVTGANRGLGLGLANSLVKSGFVVYQGTREQTEGGGSGSSLRPIKLDVTDDESIQHAAQVIKREHGALDVLINNAGLGRESATDNHQELISQLDSLDRHKLLHIMNVNAISAVMVARGFVPLMVRPGAVIINISSDRGSFGDEGTSGATNANYGYRASKAALNMLTQCLVFDLPPNVQTCAVHPGHVRTDLNPSGKLTPDEAAHNVISLLDAWRPEYNGAFLHTDGTPYTN